MKTIDVRISCNDGYNITAESILATFDYIYTEEAGITVTELQPQGEQPVAPAVEQKPRRMICPIGKKCRKAVLPCPHRKEHDESILCCEDVQGCPTCVPVAVAEPSNRSCSTCKIQSCCSLLAGQDACGFPCWQSPAESPCPSCEKLREIIKRAKESANRMEAYIEPQYNLDELFNILNEAQSALNQPKGGEQCP